MLVQPGGSGYKLKAMAGPATRLPEPFVTLVRRRLGSRVDVAGVEAGQDERGVVGDGQDTVDGGVDRGYRVGAEIGVGEVEP
ncbi:hypothetical protein [Streptomyces sp. NPDC048442]|uniref:hypothetical protein n=1 Tax=Streptomyces sp. NPDC048442 TaxID=3154823 RepID=UPI003431ABB3